MTTTAPRSRTGADRPVSTDLAERPTHGVRALDPFLTPAHALLDHRTLERTIPAAAAPPGRYLAVEAEDGERLLALERPITHVGRGLVADVRLEDAHVSRRHAVIALRGEGVGGVRVLDDRSADGTWVNGRQVTVAPLTDGDVVRFGRAVFRYVEIARRPARADGDRLRGARPRRPSGGWGTAPRPRTPSGPSSSRHPVLDRLATRGVSAYTAPASQ